jgi:acyl-CoA reductase-like NAD-dependent aldehyde dehydrogenase
MVVKPSELTSGTTLRLGKLVQEAGLPDGVVNIVVSALVEHARSVPVGDPLDEKTQVGAIVNRESDTNCGYSRPGWVALRV